VIGNIATLVGGCTALVAAIAAFVWWIYRRGLEAGRTQARLERLEDEVRKRRTRLQTRGVFAERPKARRTDQPVL
jgi:uncharacterized iron-regulated membrane protein